MTSRSFWLPYLHKCLIAMLLRRQAYPPTRDENQSAARTFRSARRVCSIQNRKSKNENHNHALAGTAATSTSEYSPTGSSGGSDAHPAILMRATALQGPVSPVAVCQRA